MKTRQEKPRRVHIAVTESGKKTADVRIPYGMFKLGMKYGAQAAKDEPDGCAAALELLGAFDCGSFERSIASSEQELPCTLVDVDDAQDDTQVRIVVE